MMNTKIQNIIAYISLIFLSYIPTIPTEAKISVPSVVLLSFNHNNQGSPYYNNTLPESVLEANSSLESLTAGQDIPSNDYQIYGSIYSNCPNGNCGGSNKIYYELLTPSVTLENYGHKIKLNMSTKILNDSDKPNRGEHQSIVMQQTNNIKHLPWETDFVINGDIDESTLSANHPIGEYQGICSIRITIE